jgi:hypothetical protein
MWLNKQEMNSSELEKLADTGMQLWREGKCDKPTDAVTSILLNRSYSPENAASIVSEVGKLLNQRRQEKEAPGRAQRRWLKAFLKSEYAKNCARHMARERNDHLVTDL